MTQALTRNRRSLYSNVKRKIQAIKSARMKVAMQGTDTEEFIVAMELL
jgi:hypothetical protein